jgi:hypothetical protein
MRKGAAAKGERTMRWISLIAVLASAAVATALSARTAAAQAVEATSRGFQEVPPISTQGEETFLLWRIREPQ